MTGKIKDITVDHFSHQWTDCILLQDVSIVEIEFLNDSDSIRDP